MTLNGSSNLLFCEPQTAFLLPQLVVGVDVGQVYPRRVFSGFIKINNVSSRVFNFEI